MTQNFASAASRHLRDIDYLDRDSRWDNVAYLAGYVGECSLKAVIEQAGNPPRVHLNKLDVRHLLLVADLCYAVRRYPVDLDADLASLRAAWTPDLRYSATGTILQAHAQQMASEAKHVYSRTIGDMILDGMYVSVPK